MALAGKTVADTYKDLLTVNSVGFDGQGLESTAKRVLDGEGIGSPLYLGTDSLDIIGTTTITGATTVTGNLNVSGTLTAGTLNITTIGNDLAVTGDVNASDSLIADKLKLRNTTTNTEVQVLRFINSSSATHGGFLDLMTDVISKGTIQLFGENGGTMLLDPDSDDSFQKGDGTKGKISLKDTEVILKKDTKELLKAKEDGTIRFQNVTALPNTPTKGDIVNKDGVVFVAVD
jgi:hypothetical protein